MANTTVYLKDYQPPRFQLSMVSLTVDLHDDYTLVTNTMHLLRQSPGDLELDGEALELISLAMNDAPIAGEHYTLEEKKLTLRHCPDEFDLTVVTKIYPQNNTVLSGLYRSNGLFCTQCEAQGFRRITYFIDRPDVMAIYHTRIIADKKRYPVLLSNGNLMDSGDLDNDRHWALWHDPFKKPSYLFALVAGDLVSITDTFVTCSQRTVDLFIYVEKGHEDQCHHAMQSLKAAMRWDEEEYGREYDLSRFMIVAVRDFNMGAMENKGLNIFNSKYILAKPDTATDLDYLGIESVVAHEYFHNWTGNRITCRDWFQLSLKEGLTVFRDQEFSSDMNSRDVQRISDVGILRRTQFPEDAGSMAHPVRPESYEEINNFYTATVYNKGAEVIRMQQTLLGKEGFRRGMDLYFQRHDGQAVTIDDFVQAMSDANEVDLTQFKRWYSQKGTPEVSVQTRFEAGKLTITLTQSITPPLHIPIRVTLFTQDGQSIPLEHSVLELKKQVERFEFNALPKRPLISLLQDFSAPIILHHPMDKKDQVALLRYETNGFAKWNIAQNLALETLLTCYKTPEGTWQIPLELIDVYHHILKDISLDFALRAKLLAVPDSEDMMALLKDDIDALLIEQVRDFYRKTMGNALREAFLATYNQLWQEEDHGMHGLAYGRRQLRNLCLWYLMKANELESLPYCQNQHEHALTMSDKIASCSLLVNASSLTIRQQAINDFYRQYQDNDLVMDKWFAMQAISELPDTLAKVESLLVHPRFDLKNPNNVRALIGTFSQMNPRHFHAKDGSGYHFLTQMLLKLDKINPQIAARLATPFTRGARLSTTYRKLIKQALDTLLTHELSRDLQEVVTKSRASYG